MKQAVQCQTDCAISRQGWRLWRTLDAAHTAEYVLATSEKTERATCLMAGAMAALLEGMSVAVILGDGEGNGRLAKTVMARMNKHWSDCRLLARASGAVFVAICDNESHGKMIDELVDLATRQSKSGTRMVGYLENVLPEVRYANLMDNQSHADIELELINAKQLMMRIRLNTEAISDSEVWSRLETIWKAATA